MSTADLSVSEIIARINALKEQIEEPAVVPSTTQPASTAVTKDNENVVNVATGPVPLTAEQILKKLDTTSAANTDAISNENRGVVTGRTRRKVLTKNEMLPIRIEQPIGLNVDKGIQAIIQGSTDEEKELEEELEKFEDVKTITKDVTTGGSGVETNIKVIPEIPKVKIPELKTLTPSEKQKIVSTLEFSKFMEEANSKTVRLLNANAIIDVMALATVDITASGTRGGTSGIQEGDYTLSRIQKYQNASTKYRPIYGVNLLGDSNDQIVVGYGAKSVGESFSDPEGLIAIWNLLRHDLPERELISRAAVTALSVNPFNSNIIATGDVNGSIQLFDLRSPSKLPTVWSMLDSNGHQMPIQSIIHTGSSAAHQILSIDTEGRLCSWSTNSLARPVVTVDILRPHYGNAAQPKLNDIIPIVTPTCAIGNPYQSNYMTIGCYDGTIMESAAYDQASVLGGIQKMIASSAKADVSMSSDQSNPEGHNNAVTALSWLHDGGSMGLPATLLSGGLDGRVSMWSPDGISCSCGCMDPNKSGVNPLDQGLHRKPIFSYLYSAYISSLAHHPIHPGIFSCGSGSTLDLWSLGSSTVGPACSIELDENGGSIGKMTWATDGSRLWTGSYSGELTLYGFKMSSDIDTEILSRDFENSFGTGA